MFLRADLGAVRTTNLSAGRVILKGKSKDIGRPISNHVDTDREQWYSSTVSLTSALDWMCC